MNPALQPPPGNPTMFVAALIAILPAIVFALYLIFQVLKQRAPAEQSTKKLTVAAGMAIGSSLIIVGVEAFLLSPQSTFFHSVKSSPAMEKDQTTQSFPVFDFDFDGKKCDAALKEAGAALASEHFEQAMVAINRAIHYNKNRADLQITRAIINMHAGRASESIEELNAVLKADPHEAEALLARSRAYFDAQDYEHSARDAKQLLEQKKHEVEAEVILADIQIKMQDFKVAIEEYQKALKLEPENSRALAGLGDCQFHGADFQSALHSYDEALKRNGDSTELLFKRGRTLLGLDKNQEAIDDFSKSVKGSPSTIEYRRTLALAYFKENKLLTALDELDKALHQDPYDEESKKAAQEIAEKLADESRAELAKNRNKSTSHATLAYAMYMMHSYDDALKAINKAIALDPKNGRDYFLAGECAIEAKQDKSAIAYFEKAIELEPKNINAIFEMARAQSSMENFQDSIANYTKFITNCPERNKATAFIARGICYINLRDFQNTVADFTESLKYSPNNAEVYALRGDAYGCLDDRIHAMDDLQKAIALDPNSPLCHHNLTNEFLREGNFTAALAAAKAATKIKPKDPSLHCLVSQVLCLLGDYDQAQSEAESAVELDPNTAKIRSQQAAVYWVLDKTDELKKSCDFLRNGTEGKDKGEAYSDVYFSGFWPYIFYSSLDDKKSADEILNAAAARMDGQVWPHPIFQFLQGKIKAEELLKQKSDLWSLTEIHCYVGCAQYYSGQKDLAKQNLKWVVDKGRKDFLEYMLALGLVRKNKW